MPTSPAHDYVGEKVGEFSVVSYDGGGRWRCLCSCGSERRISSTDLRRRKWKSCGCKRAENVSIGKTRHGHGRSTGVSSTYKSWAAMISRCTNPRNNRWHRYGGRGISVCEGWRTFEGFLADMGEKPPGMTLDRENNDGGYHLGNCRWATSKMQGRTCYQARRIEALGETHLLTDWAIKTGLKRETIARRLNAGWTPERALTVKAAPWNR